MAGVTQPSILAVSAAGAGMTCRRVSVLAADVVFLKSIVEASEGIASIFGERGGELTIATPPGREPELDELLADVARDCWLRVQAQDEAVVQS